MNTFSQQKATLELAAMLKPVYAFSRELLDGKIGEDTVVSKTMLVSAKRTVRETDIVGFRVERTPEHALAPSTRFRSFKTTQTVLLGVGMCRVDVDAGGLLSVLRLFQGEATRAHLLFSCPSACIDVLHRWMLQARCISAPVDVGEPHFSQEHDPKHEERTTVYFPCDGDVP